MSMRRNMYKQPAISNKLIAIIKQLQKQLQEDEDVKFKRKAVTVTFVYASHELARRLMK